MADFQDPTQTNDSGAGSEAAWVQAAQAYLSHGGTLDNSGQWDPPRGKFGLPPDYSVDGTQIVHDTQLGSSLIKGALGTAAGVAAGLALPATAAATVGSAAPATSIPTAFGSTAVDTIASAAPAAAAAPGVSAGLPDWLKTAEDVTQGLGAAAGGRAQGRNLDNLSNIGFAQAQNDLYNSELAAPQKLASNAVRGDILSNARDVSIAAPSTIPVPTISGGLRPSMFSDTTRQVGKNITANAAATPTPTPTPPVLQPMETAGPTDTILNTAGYLGNLAKPAYDIWKMFNHA